MMSLDLRKRGRRRKSTLSWPLFPWKVDFLNSKLHADNIYENVECWESVSLDLVLAAEDRIKI